jgi:hypothetical protein
MAFGMRGWMWGIQRERRFRIYFDWKNSNAYDVEITNHYG